MTNRAPKVARLIPIDTPDNSSSDSDSETEQEGKEIQVELEARSPEEDDYHGISRLLQQLFLRNQVVNVCKMAETILGRCDVQHRDTLALSSISRLGRTMTVMMGWTILTKCTQSLLFLICREKNR
jgi:hypothetical protein